MQLLSEQMVNFLQSNKEKTQSTIEKWENDRNREFTEEIEMALRYIKIYAQLHS